MPWKKKRKKRILCWTRKRLTDYYIQEHKKTTKKKEREREGKRGKRNQMKNKETQTRYETAKGVRSSSSSCLANGLSFASYEVMDAKLISWSLSSAAPSSWLVSSTESDFDPPGSFVGSIVSGSALGCPKNDEVDARSGGGVRGGGVRPEWSEEDVLRIDVKTSMVTPSEEGSPG